GGRGGHRERGDVPSNLPRTEGAGTGGGATGDLGRSRRIAGGDRPAFPRGELAAVPSALPTQLAGDGGDGPAQRPRRRPPTALRGDDTAAGADERARDR